MSQKIIVEKKAHSATIRLNRPTKRNPLDLETVNGIARTISDCDLDDSIRTIVITGSGSNAFASGADLREMADVVTSADTAIEYDKEVKKLYRSIQDAQTPVIAKVQSHAIGGGGLLAVACDICIASDKAKFGLPAGRVGLMLSPLEYEIALQRMTLPRAKYLTMTGALIDANQANLWGIFDVVVNDVSLDPAIEKLTTSIAECAPSSIKVSKILLSEIASRPDTPISGDRVRKCYETVYDSEDYQEGVAAFLERRPPAFKGN